MFTALKGLGLAGGLGFLVGLVLVSYIRPTEDGGVFLLIAIPTVLFSVVGSGVGWLTGKKAKSARGQTGDAAGNDDEI